MASLGLNRRQLLDIMEECFDKVAQEKRQRETGQISLFDVFGEAEASKAAIKIPDLTDFSVSEILEMEKDLLGFYVSGHPLDQYTAVLRKHGKHSIGLLGECEDKAEVTIAGMIAEVRVIVTKAGRRMAFAQVEDFGGTIEVVFFPQIFEKQGEQLIAGRAAMLRGAITRREERVSLAVNEVTLLGLGECENDTDRQPERISLRLDKQDKSHLEELRNLLQRTPGPVPVYLLMPEASIRVDQSLYVAFGPYLKAELESKLGASNVEILWRCT